MRFTALNQSLIGGLLVSTILGSAAMASSHNEAPAIAHLRQVDGVDFYMFRSYEEGRQGYITAMGNYFPLQQPYGAVVFFPMDEDALYEIHFDNDGDNVEDLTFQFNFDVDIDGVTVNAGGVDTEVALYSAGVIGPNPEDNAALNIKETFTLTLIEGDRRTGRKTVLRNRDTGSSTFIKPADYVGTKTFGGPGMYETYARNHIFEFDLPNCPMPGRVFAGQRKDPFYVNLGQAFDLLNFQVLNDDGTADGFVPVGRAVRDVGPDVTDDDNVTSLAIEIPIQCATANDDPVIGGWTTSSLPRARLLNRNLSERRRDPEREAGPFVQVSRLGSALVNELVIGLSDKDRFNNSEPKDDAQFATFVTNPSFPEVVESQFGSLGVVAPNLFPREDLVATFLTGLDVPGAFNTVPASGTALSEMLRLDTSVTPTPFGEQNPLGVLDFEEYPGGEDDPDFLAPDPAGYPNGRRPGDDVIDLTLRASLGTLISIGLFGEASDAPAGLVPLVDGAQRFDTEYFNRFPYFTTPIPGDRDD